MTSFSQAHAFSTNLYNNGTSPISGLFGWRRPSAILRPISLAVINAFNRMPTRWFWPHIVKKYTKVTPFFTDCYPASTIQMEVVPMSIVASGHHTHPCSIFRRLRIAGCLSMLCHSSTNCISNKTSATFRIPTRQIDSNDNLLHPTIAQAYPFALAMPSLFGTMKNCQPSKTLSC